MKNVQKTKRFLWGCFLWYVLCSVVYYGFGNKEESNLLGAMVGLVGVAVVAYEYHNEKE